MTKVRVSAYSIYCYTASYTIVIINLHNSLTYINSYRTRILITGILKQFGLMMRCDWKCGDARRGTKDLSDTLTLYPLAFQ